LNEDLKKIQGLSSENDRLAYLQTAPKFRAYHAGASYSQRHGDLEKAISDWFAANQKRHTAISATVWDALRANYQVIPAGHTDHFLVGKPMQGASTEPPLLNALNALPLVSGSTPGAPVTPLHFRRLHLESLSETTPAAATYAGKTFTIDNADARLRNDDLSAKKYKTGDPLPAGKKVGDFVTLAPGAQVKISDVTTNSERKVFVEVYDAASGGAGSPLGWTSSENFAGRLHNEILESEPAVYDVVPAANAAYFTVGDHEALVRKSGPGYEVDKAKGKLTQGLFVAITETSKDTSPPGKYVKLASLRKNGSAYATDKDLGWTAKTNLTPGLADFKGPNAAWVSVAKGVPGDYVGQKDLLTIVANRGKRERIAVDIYPAYKDMVAAAASAGAEIVIEDGFRRFSDQEHLYQLYLQGKGNLAAIPGRSNHQNGIALD
jgi:hypothetical protein